MAKMLTYPAVSLLAVGDAFGVVDISDTTDDATGSTKYATFGTLQAQILAQAGWTPANQGLIAYNYDPSMVNVNQSTPASGTLFCAALEVPVSSVTGVVVLVGTAGSGVTHSAYALYDAAGTTRLGVTADNNTAHQSTGLVQTNFTCGPIAVATAGIYYVGMVFTAGTTIPGLGRCGSSAAVNAGTSASNFRYATANTGLTAPPSTRTTMTASTTSIWVGLI